MIRVYLKHPKKEINPYLKVLTFINQIILYYNHKINQFFSTDTSNMKFF